MIDNTEKKRFELEENGLVTFATYKIDGQQLYINHVEAPVELRGTGSAGRLMQQIVEFAQNGNYKIIPVCPYAAVWLKRNNISA